MTLDTIVREVLEHPTTANHIPPSLHQPLADDIAAGVIARLKQEADRHWWIDAHRSLYLAGLIVHIGEQRADQRQTALGLMARGDALKFLARIDAAWDALDAAGTLFQAAGDEVGWGRTRIGRLLISPDVNQVEDALADAARAEAVFARHDAHEMRLRLAINTGILHGLLGNYRDAVTHYTRARALAAELGADGEPYLGMIDTNMGLAHTYLGHLADAARYHESARAFFEANGEAHGAAAAMINLAYVAQAQGHYRRALALLHQVDRDTDGHLMIESSARRDMVECYLHLNRLREARDLAHAVAAEYDRAGAAYEHARTLLLQATADAQLGHLDTARTALDTAEAIFETLNAPTWLATIWLRRGRIALEQGDLATARAMAAAAAGHFAAQQQPVDHAGALLLDGQALLAAGHAHDAIRAGQRALQIAQQSRVPAVRYSAHVLLGRASDAAARSRRAERHYQAALRTVERVQAGLTLTLRTGFLEDKQEAAHALIRSHLAAGRAACALAVLERSKSQVWLSYIANREQLRWATNDPAAHALLDELNTLRAEHHFFYQMAYQAAALESADQTPGGLSPQDAQTELAARETRLRDLLEQLHLLGGADRHTAQAATPPLDAIRARIPDGALLLAFYSDGDCLWGFAVDHQGVTVHPLGLNAAALNQIVGKLQFNIACALRVAPQSPTARNLVPLARRLLEQAYTGLLGPLADRLRDAAHVIIVPYGALHYLPFHLLHAPGNGYLFQTHMLSTLPSAGLITQPAPRRAPGALVLAHTRAGQLPHTLAEARHVQAITGGDLLHADNAHRARLTAPPRQVLHIAAHGEHRIDQPDLSYIELDDGQLFSDDLMQHDLSYELVTLSACETGRARVAASDELIGLGRGFLYAGAGSLITSLWRVDDALTADFMRTLYHDLYAGQPKAAALQNAQQTMLAAHPDLHPAYWGAFQLVGDPGPLSRRVPQHHPTPPA